MVGGCCPRGLYADPMGCGTSADDKIAESFLQNQLRKRLGSGANVRYAMVCYRDFDCAEHPVILPFGDVRACQHFLEGVRATGGEDWRFD